MTEIHHESIFQRSLLPKVHLDQPSWKLEMDKAEKQNQIYKKYSLCLYLISFFKLLSSYYFICMSLSVTSCLYISKNTVSSYGFYTENK